jgi:RNA polymerase sigma factor for flagellar operon FliA
MLHKNTMSNLTDQEMQRQIQLQIQQQIRLHTPLVEMLARNLAKKLPSSVDCADLIQDGHVALINAILSTSKKVTAAHFKNYLALRVQGAMLDGLRVLDPGSRQLRKDMRKVERAMQLLGHALGRAPLESELAAELGMPLQRYQRMLQEASDYNLISLDDILELDGDLFSLCADRDVDPLAMLERAALKESLATAICGLSRQSGAVLSHYYVDDLKMHQIGKLMHVSEARVSQIHAQAIAELRAKLVDESGAIASLKPRRTARATAAVRNAITA